MLFDMRHLLHLMLLSALLPLHAAQVAPLPTLEQSAVGVMLAPWLDKEADASGNSLLLTLCRTAGSSNKITSAYLQPFITSLLINGANPLTEDANGCNAVFYLSGMPDYYAVLKHQNLIPRELALRLPPEEHLQLRYMKLRASQIPLAPAPGSREYLVRRYCAPFYEKAEDRLAHYMQAEGLYVIPESGLSTCLAFMRIANPQRAHAYINNLSLWQHGEHFLEEIPSAFLQDLTQLSWQVNPGKLRLALQKLNSMLPSSADDMIDCNAAAPMSALLELLVNQEGRRALPDLKKYADTYDPELAQAVLRLELKLNGITPPDETEEEPKDAELVAMREALQTDAALHQGILDGLTAEKLVRVAAYLNREGLPRHAEIISSMVEEGELIATETSMPAIRAEYETLQEERPRVRLLRKLLTQVPATHP